MNDNPIDLDKHRGMAEQKATDIRRVMADVESHAEELRERQKIIEGHIVAEPAASWPEAAAKARYVLNLYAAALDTQDTRHRQLVAAVLADFARLTEQGSGG
jgi:hypothetical protein